MSRIVVLIKIKEIDTDNGFELKLDCVEGDIITLIKKSKDKESHICDMEVGK